MASRWRVIRLTQPEDVLGDHVAEHLERPAVDADQRREPVDVFGGAVVGGAVGPNGQRRRRAEDVHQVGRDVAHRLRERHPPEDARSRQGRLHPGDAAPQAICHRSVVDQPASVGIGLGDLGGRLVDRGRHETGLVHHDRHVLQAVRRGFHRTVLDVERFTHDGPAGVHVSESVLVVDADIAVVDDVGAVAVDGADALDLDARRVERDQKHGEALVLRRIRVGVGDEVDVLAVVCAGGEHLRAVDHPGVTVSHRAGLARGDIRTPFGLGVAQAQPHMAAENTGHHLGLELR